MDRSNVITLVARTFAPDGMGVQVPTETTRQVYASVQSVSLEEWTQGGRLGLNPEYRFTMFEPDYNGESIVEYKGTRFSIYRTYHARNDSIELYAERRSGSD